MMIHVKVTQEHIDKGIPSDLCNCPIALAMKDNFTFVEINGNVRCAKNETIYRGLLGPITLKFIKDFDNGREVKPFEFDIELYKVNSFVEMMNDTI